MLKRRHLTTAKGSPINGILFYPQVSRLLGMSVLIAFLEMDLILEIPDCLLL
ncbi:MAG: hypothetical protein ACJAV5_000104 [Vicingaceae bacterium]|jgi:hypothetical protein